MKAIPGLKLRALGRDSVLVPQGGGLIGSNKIISFNATAAYLWEAVSQRDSFCADDLAGLLMIKYGVDEKTAATDAKSVCDKWVEAGIVTD